jgi:hypothetical protein
MLALAHFLCSAIVSIHEEANTERHRRQFFPKKYPLSLDDGPAAFPSQLSPLSLYC